MNEVEFLKGRLKALRAENVQLIAEIDDLQDKLAMRETGVERSVQLAAVFDIPKSWAYTLVALIDAAPMVVSKPNLLAPHSKAAHDDYKMVDVVITRMRSWLRTKGYGDCIKTIWGGGYSISIEAADGLVNLAEGILERGQRVPA